MFDSLSLWTRNLLLEVRAKMNYSSLMLSIDSFYEISVRSSLKLKNGDIKFVLRRVLLEKMNY